MKISVVGHCGCGKTALATKISETFKIPQLELDRLYFKHGGAEIKTPDDPRREEVRQKINQDVEGFLTKHSDWVSAGVYGEAQTMIAEAAEQIVFIDIPLWRRQFNHLKRLVTQRNRHPEISLWQDLYFTYDMFRRTKDRRPFLHTLQTQYPDKWIHLTSYSKVDQYYSALYLD